jgi:tetratricopeptide (TPR) repeat protein
MDTLDEVSGHHYRQAQDAAADPAATGWERGLANGVEGIANLIVAHRDYYRSHGHGPWGCQVPPEVSERLAAFAPNDVEWLRRLSDAYEIVGDEQYGEPYNDALPSYRTALYFRGRLLAADPGNAEGRQRASGLRKKIDDLVAAKPQWDADKAKADEQARRHDLMSSSRGAGSKFLAAGKTEEALASFRAALSEAEWLHTHHPNSGYEPYVRSIHEDIADVQLAAGNTDAALAVYRDRIAVLEPAREAWPADSVKWVGPGLDLAEFYRKTGDAYRSAGKLEKALAGYRAGLAICEHVVATFFDNPACNRKLAVIRERVAATTRQLDAGGARTS